MTPAGRILHEKRRLIWPIAIVLILNVALFTAVVYPLSRKVASDEANARAATGALDSARRDYAAARATVTGKSQASEALERFYADVLPPDLSGARRITFQPLDRLAKECNLRLEREGTERKSVRGSSLVRFSYTAKLAGEYRDIRRFIHAVETAAEFMVLENVELSQAGEGKGLDVTVQIATYYRAGGDGD